MHKQSIHRRSAAGAAAWLILMWCSLGALAQPVCTNVSTRFIGVPATNCILAPVSQQATNPVCEIVNDGFPLAYWLVTLTNAPAGYSLTNGIYRGWCADYDVIIESGIVYKPIAYLSTLPLPPHLANPNWNRVNFILNHKQGTAFDVQAAIWRFIGGPVSPFDPVFGTLTAAGSNMVAQATSFGSGFIPGAGEVTAVILDVGPTNQLHFIEVACPAILDVCHGGRLTLCTTNTGSAPLSFMWFQNGVMIPGAIGSCLSLSGLTPADSGTYSVKVSNPCSAATNAVSLIISNTADVVPPVIVCASDRNYQCLGQVPPAPDFSVVTATDDSGQVTLTFVSETIITNGCALQVIRRYQAADPCGNVVVCDHTDVVRDTLPPTLTGVPANATFQCLVEVPAPPAVSATDNCDTNVQVLRTSTTNGACPILIQHEWIALDRCGNGVTNSQLITVRDTVRPTLTCPPALIVPNVASIPPCPGTLALFLASGGAAGDNCDLSLAYFCVDGPMVGGDCGGQMLRTHTVIDDCTNAITCVQTIMILTSAPPVITCPPALTVSCLADVPPCPGSLNAFLAAGGTAFGNIVSYTCTDSPLTGGACGGTITRTHRVTDACSNSVSCTQRITLNDTTPPVITCATNFTVQCGASWAFGRPSATDLCSGTNVTIEIVSTLTNAAGFCGNTFSVTRTWRALDACTNAATCSQTITIVDTVPPVITCASNATFECGSPWTFTRPTAVDICDGTNVTIAIISTVTNAGPCGRTFSATRTWRALDSCSNAAVCSQTITVVDTLPPVLTCAPDAIIECGAPWEFTPPQVGFAPKKSKARAALQGFTPPSATDLCDGTNVILRILSTVTNTAGFCGGTFSATCTWEALDACQNRATCSQTIVVVDLTLPVITCAPDRAVECSSTWSFTPPTATDLCAGTNVTITILSTVTNAGPCGATFRVTRTWRAADACNNSAQCAQTITLVDTTPPVLTCASNQVFECGSSWAFTRPLATDNCDGTNVTITILSTVTNAGPCGKALTATRTWRAYDSCTNQATCSQTITVLDTTPPVLSCAPDAFAECGTPWAFTPPFAEDACDGTNVAVTIVDTVTNRAGFCGNTFRATRTWRAADSCTNVATCNQTITVIDTRPPQLTCAPDEVVECGQPWDFTPALAIDLCDGQVPVSIVSTLTNTANPRCPNLFSVTRTWRASDSCSNRAECSQTITLIDTRPPTIACASNAVIECHLPWAFTPPTAVDICDGANVAISVVSTITNAANPRCPALYSVTRTWRAVDTCLNSAQCSQTITLVDTTPPTLTCSADRAIECSSIWFFNPPAAADLCDGTNVTITILSTVTNAGPCGANYRITRTWRAADTCNNSAQCAQTITLIDTTPPVLTCASNQVFECGSSWAFIRPLAIDNCDGTNVTIEILSTVTNAGPCGKAFTATRTWRAYDSCTNQATCSQTITVLDTTPPILSCAPDAFAECGTPWAFTPPFAEDACDGTNVAVTIVDTVTNRAGFCGNTFRATRTWRAADSCTNIATCNQTITVIDTRPPQLVCAPNQIVDCHQPWAFTAPTATDLCDPNVVITILSTVTNSANPRCPNLFSVTRTWRAADACSNAVECTQTITLVDVTPPNLTCQPDAVVECGSPWDFSPPSAVDLCEGTAVTVTILSTVTNAASPRCPGLMSITRTWRAADSCNNAAQCRQTITLVDTRPPTLTCAADRVIECGEMVMFTAPTAVDICDSTNVVIEILSTVTNAASPRCPGLYSVKRTWRATDTCGNNATCSQSISVVDTRPPVLTCAADRIAECGDMHMFTAPTAVDICDSTNVVIEIISTITNTVSPRCPGLYNLKRTWRAADSCGNETFCSQTINVVDTTPPTLSCAENRTIECGDMVMFTPPAAMDVCDGTNITVAIVSTLTNAASPRCPGLYSVKRTWRAADSCGNESQCSQTINVVDTRPPALTCAENRTIECGDMVMFTAPTAVDICDSTNVVIGIVSTVTNAASPRCPGLYSVKRTWRAADTCGNEAFCSQTINVVDTRPPALTCAENRTIECGDTVVFTAPTAVDICDSTNVLIEIVGTATNAASPRCPGLYSVKRTWRAADTCGNESFCSQTINVVDTRPPELTCARNETIECGHPWAFTAPTAMDICDGPVVPAILSSVTNASCGRTLTATRTWRAADSCGNAATCSQTIAVVDTTPPALICAEDRSVECAMPWSFIPPAANDLCDGTNISLVIVSTVTNAGACPNNYTAVRTWRATDTCGNAATCSQAILVADTRPPVLLCAADRVVECGLPWAFMNPSVNDLCDGTNVTLVIVSTITNAPGPDCPNLFSVVRTWRATDRCGNSSQCSQSVLEMDSTPPALACPSDRIIECGQPWNFGTPFADDLCDGTNLTLRIVSTITNAHPSCPKAFTAIRVWSAMDRCGNLSMCGQAITVVDTTPPNITCADSFIIECGQPWDFTRPFADDVCDGTNVAIQITGTVTNNLGCGRNMSVTRTWRAFDSCTNISQCSQTVTIVDTHPPTLVCAADRVVECGGTWNFSPPSANDVCHGTNITLRIVSTVTNLGSCGRTFTATRTWEAIDECTNRATCSQTINVVDTQPPVLVCAPNRVVECGQPWNFEPPTATDLCDTNVTVRIVNTTTNNAGFCGLAFSATRLWEAIDACGNRSTCSQTVRLVDTQPPVITCAPDFMVECGQPWAFVLPTATDVCDPNVNIVIVNTVTNTAGLRCPQILSVRRTWRATDACGNPALCSQTVIILDTVPPVLLNVPANASYKCMAAVPPPALVGVTDVCDPNPRLRLDSSTNGACPTLITRTWTAYDSCSNTVSATQIITVIEDPPVITAAPADTAVCPGSNVTFCVTATGDCGLTYQWSKNGVLIPGATDRCHTISNAQPADAGRYCVVVRSPCHAVTNCANLSFIPNVEVGLVPTPLCLIVGTNLSFCPPITGPTPYTCAWYHNGLKLQNAGTNCCLDIPSFAPGMEGTYTLYVTGICNVASSTLTLPLPMVFCGPDGCDDKSVCEDGSFTLCETIFQPMPGVSYSYQWFRGDAGVTNFIAGETNQCITRTNVTPADAGFYGVRVVATLNGGAITQLFCGGTITILRRTVADGPRDQMVCAGTNVIFSVTASGTGPFTYMWFKDGLLVPGQTNNSILLLNVTPADMGLYCVKVTGFCGSVTNCARLNLRSAVGDFVWEDLNFNGCQDPNEPGVSNVVVELLSCGSTSPLRTTVTDGSGRYLFDCVEPGDYRVRFYTPSSAWMFTLQTNAVCTAAGDSDPDMATGMSRCFTLPPGTTDLTHDAGMIRKACLGDFVWEDLNHDGHQDAGEPGIPNVLLQLFDCATSNLVAATTTGPNGEYLFCNLIPGSYRVEIVVPDGYTITVPNTGTNDCADSDANPGTRLTQCVVLPPGANDLCLDIGLKRFSALGDYVWHDLNRDGRQTPGEPGMSNVTVRLYECAGLKLIATQLTDSNGRYLFGGLTGGTYKVTFVAPPGLLFTTQNAVGVPDDLDSDADPETGMTGCYVLPPGTTNLTVDAGLFPPLPPCIDVTKTVACLLPADQCGPFGKIATGYRSATQNPAFCYSITISNCGGHILTNLSVLDDKMGDLTTNFFASKLTQFPPAATLTRYYKMPWDVDTTNTVNASGRAMADGAQQVNDNDQAIALVENASITCQTTVYSPDDQDTSFTDGHVTLVDDGTAHEVTFMIVVCNDGDVDLANVTIRTPGMAALGCADPAPFNLARGACLTNILCVKRLACDILPLSLTNFVSAAVDTRNNHCGYDLAGSNITARSECHMEVQCGMPGSCRVTGGGRQENSFPSVRYVTHGGQVGAPVGNAGFDPGTFEREGSECIHGNWEHVRHEKGGSRGNFHAKIYDSLMCACLGCPEDPLAGVVVGGLCNPDNRICGPEPRRAPANKICFSGIGDYAMTGGNREARSVLFRVDIEDRSEPGNTSSGGQKPPPDRHRIRIWILTDAEKAQLNNPSDRLLNFRRAISCSPGSTALQDGAVGANGLAVPLGTAVFGLRAPDIDDGGEMDHGNHQIHPMIKDCPK